MAQNPNYAPGDLILGFQNPGGTTGADKTFFINLGNTALDFRDATSNRINIANIGAALTTNFGASWWEANTLYMSVFGLWGTSATNSTLTNLDPHRTLYISASRGTIGTAGTAGSFAWSVGGDGAMTTGASNIKQAADTLETQSIESSATVLIGNTFYDNQNPFLQPGQQNTAYATFAGGVQFGFSANPFGTLGGLTIEGALDLYRIQARDNIAGQYNQGAGVREGEFQGTVVIDQAGNVSFLNAVPEPSTIGLLTLSSLALGFVRRRRA